MKRFMEREDRTQVTLLPACLDDYVEAENPVRVVEVFVDGLDLGALGFVGVHPAATAGRRGRICLESAAAHNRRLTLIRETSILTLECLKHVGSGSERAP